MLDGVMKQGHTGGLKRWRVNEMRFDTIFIGSGGMKGDGKGRTREVETK